MLRPTPDGTLLSFGVASERYRDRPGAYGITIRDGSLLVVQGKAGVFLPGGGLEDGETVEDALRREYAEETGFSVVGCEFLWAAYQFVAERGTWMRKHCSFFVVRASDVATAPVDCDEVPAWVPVERALALMVEEASVHAVRRALDADQPSPSVTQTRRMRP